MYSSPCYGVSIVNFEQVNTGWDGSEPLKKHHVETSCVNAYVIIYAYYDIIYIKCTHI